MKALPACLLAEVLIETPALPQRDTENFFDFGDMRTVGKKVCVGGDETYRGIFLGQNLRLGFVVGVVGKAVPSQCGEQFQFVNGEAFASREEMLSRWILE